MASLKYFLVILVILSIATVAFSNAIEPRMVNGAVVDTMQRFAHHVTIEPINSSNERNLCGGSIISKNWILTSLRCVEGSSSLKLLFKRLHRNDSAGSFGIEMNNDPDNVKGYPTLSDDIALVRIPVDLIFSNTIKDIYISKTPVSQLQNKLAVLPGFNSDNIESDTLTYSMLNIVSNDVCKSSFKYGVFDEYNQICTTTWGNYKNAPCLSESGSGLIVNWPAEPTIIGIFSGSSNDCDSSSPSAYTNIQKYTAWIESVTSSQAA